MFVCQRDTEILFPDRVIPQLRELRGRDWAAVVETAQSAPADHPDRLSFGLLMVRLNGCISCHADSYRAMRGCTTCARNTVTRYKGSDSDLVGEFQAARQTVDQYLADGQVVQP